MSERVSTYVHATDPLSLAGIAAELRTHPGLELVDIDGVSPETVGIVAVDSLAERSLNLLRQLNSFGCQRIVLVVSDLSDVGLLAAIEIGVRTVVRRDTVGVDGLGELVAETARGNGHLPKDVLGRLLDQVARLQRNVLSPLGLSTSGFTEREIQVLKLVALGMDTNEIAEQLAYSERTIKNVLHDITNRYQLKNRTHAVAFAMREGLI